VAGIQEAIYARASSHAGLMGVIGNPPRLYPVEAPQTGPQEVIAYVTYQVVSAPRPHVMVADKEAQPRVQFDCWANTWTLALAIREQVLACFDRWSGMFAGVDVHASVCENEGMTVQPDDTSRTPRITMEFEMTYGR
jgi:hypothetical protein